MTERTDLPKSPTSEFICPGCGRPLAITLRSDMCFAEVQVYCDDCERDYQQRRGKWAEVFESVGESGARGSEPEG